MSPSPFRPELLPDDALGTLPLLNSAPPDDSRATLPLAGEAETAPLLSATQPGHPVKIGRFVIRTKLGEGAFGAVYRAFDPQLEREVALKVAKPGAVDSPERRERFAREAKSAAGLRHPNIVPVYDSGEDRGQFYIASGFVDGRTLRDEIDAADGQPVNLNRAATVIRKLAEALGYAHKKGIVHRDVKPENVLVDTEGEPQVADFGLAARAGEGELAAASGGEAEESLKTQDGRVLGTPAYMSPEQAAGRSAEATAAADQYALGIMLYELATGRRPFEGPSEVVLFNHITVAPKPPRSVNRFLPRDLDAVILKCLAKEPAQRYASCEALAEDLRRYLDREPVTARRANRVQSMVRRIRRNKAASLAILALLVATLAIGAATIFIQRAREVRAAEERVALGLERAEWTGEAADGIERDIARLSALDAERGRMAQQKLIDRFGDAIRSDLRKPRVSDAEVPALEQRLLWLSTRDGESAESLKKELLARLRAWQPVIEVAAPFANVPDAFAADAVRIEADRITSVQTILATRISIPGPVRAEVDFDGDWYRSTGIGLLIWSRPDGRRDQSSGYAFLLRPAWPAGDPDSVPRAGVPPSFEAGGGSATVEILRDGLQLGVKSVRVGPGPIRLTGEQDGTLLSIQLNDGAPFSFEDLAPLPAAVSSPLALVCPEKVAIRRLRVDTQVLGAAASPLERADDSAARGKPADALPLYEAVVRETANPDIRAEARYKAGLCLMQLERNPDAAIAFEDAIAGGSPRWGIVSAFQLWRICLKAKRFEEADAVFSLVRIRYPKESVARYVPVNVRAEIDGNFIVPAMNWLVFDPKLIPRLESVLRLSELLQLPREVISAKYAMLVAAHCMAGEFAQAKAIADEHLDALLDAGYEMGGEVVPHWTARWHAWTGRLTGKPELYRERMAARLLEPLRNGESAARRKSVFLPLRLETARNLAAAGNWEEAERELDAYLAEYPEPISEYALHSAPYFMKGFLRDKAGDSPGAQAAWRSGTYSRFLENLPVAARPADRFPASRKALVEAWAMGALTDSLSDADATEAIRLLLASFGSDEVTGQVAGALNFTPAIIRGTWTSPRGREWAKRMAFLHLTPSEYFWTPPRLIVYEKLRQDLLAGKPTAEEDEALWLTTVRVCEAFRTGEISKSQLFQLALAWKGTTNLLGWAGLAPKLKPEVRGPIAYVLGLRFLKLKKPAEAADMFKSAVGDTGDASSLRKLAELELQKFDKKR